jgi:hypothetical protein
MIRAPAVCAMAASASRFCDGEEVLISLIRFKIHGFATMAAAPVVEQ